MLNNRFTVPNAMKMEWSAGNVFLFAAIHEPLMVPILNTVNVPLMKYFVGISISDEKLETPAFSSAAYSVVITGLYLTAIIWEFFKKLPLDCWMLWIAALILVILTVIGFGALNIMPMVCLAYLKSELKLILELKKITKVDILNTIKAIEKAERALRHSLVQFLMTMQVLLILVTFTTINNPANINFVLHVTAMVISILKTMGDLEESYDLVKAIANKAKEEACEETSVKEMMKLMVAVGQLEETVPFTAMKFFSFERSTVTAMVATTVTYLVVLMQTFLPAPSG